MRYAVFADVHANLEALTAALDYYRTQSIDRYICAGDLVGYGPNPSECVAMVRKLSGAVLVAGNHDRAACSLKDITWFNEYAQKSVMWTRQNLTESNLIFLSELPKIAQQGEITVVHGSPRDPLDEYLLTREQYTENLDNLKTTITFIGHSHVPLIFVPGGVRLFRGPETIFLRSDEQKIILNPGSVGQPRDGNNRASCATYDSDTGEFRIARLEYDIRVTQEKMRHARLPAFLIERLYWGK